MTVGERSGLMDGWIRNDDSPAATAHNIGLLAMKEAEIVMKRLSDIAGLRYDIPNLAFYDGEYRIPDAEAPAYLWNRIGEVDTDLSQRVGAATLRRALAVIAAEGAGRNGSVRLVGETAEAPRSLHGIFYAKDEGGKYTSERREGAGAGAESEGVPGEAGRRGSSQRLGAQEQGARARAWVKEIQSGWKSKLDVVVHDTAASIGDVRLQEAVAKGGANVEAFFDAQDGRIHLLADRLGSKAEAERLLRHEGIHWAINGKLNKEYNSILDGVRKRISKKEWEELSEAYSEATDRVRVEEYLAYLGQNNPKATAWQSFVYEFKQTVRTIFGKDFEVTDADVLAFLAKVNRKLENGETSGVRIYTASDVRFAKGSERKSWAEVQVGDDFNAVKKHLPYNPDRPEMLIRRESPIVIYAEIAKLLKSRPFIKDVDGNRVLVANRDGKSDTDMLFRSEHLAASREDRYKRGGRVYDSEKARWIPNIWKTVENCGAMIQHYNDIAYVRKYGDGTIHIVFVEKGKIVDHEFYDAAVVSQRSLMSSGGLKGATILKK